MPTNPGTDSLASWWGFNSSPGPLLDGFGSNDLTNNNGVTFAAGKQGDAAQFVRASSQLLTRSNLTSGIGGAFTAAGWINPASFSNGYGLFFFDGYLNASSGGVVARTLSTGSLRIQWSDGGSGYTLNQSGAFAGSLWSFVVFWHDGVNTMSAQVNDGAIWSAAGGAPSVAGNGFALGGRNDAPTIGHDGSLDEWGLWIGKALSADERSFLFNAGDGVTLADLSAGSPTVPIPLLMSGQVR